jgi:hypothetical protein
MHFNLVRRPKQNAWASQVSRSAPFQQIRQRGLRDPTLSLSKARPLKPVNLTAGLRPPSCLLGSAWTVDRVRRQFFNETVLDGDASPCHDEFGHVIGTALLTTWPAHSCVPIILSTEHCATEQLAELLQRMLVRCRPHTYISVRDPNARIYFLNTLSRSQLDVIDARLKAQNLQLQFGRPDPRGTKLSKLEALRWTALYALEDTHIMALKVMQYRKTKPDNPLAFECYKEDVAVWMYQLACGGAWPHNYDKFLANSLETMTCRTAVGGAANRISNCLTVGQLSNFYDTFAPYLDALEKRVRCQFGKALSAMTLTEIRALKLGTFLMDNVPFRTVLNEAKIQHSTDWQGVLSYDELRKIYCITKIIPPTIE